MADETTPVAVPVELKGKMLAFAEAYLANGFNGTKAARAAKYKGSDVTLAAVAYENLRKPQIAAYIKQRMSAMIMSADEAMARLSEHGRSDMADFANLTSETLATHPQSRLVKKYKRTRKYEELPGGFIEEKVEVELYAADDALVTILKEQHLRAGEATDHMKITGIPPLPDDQLNDIFPEDSPGS